MHKAVLGREENMDVGVLHALWPRVSVPLILVCTGAAHPLVTVFTRGWGEIPRDCGWGLSWVLVIVMLWNTCMEPQARVIFLFYLLLLSYSKASITLPPTSHIHFLLLSVSPLFSLLKKSFPSKKQRYPEPLVSIKGWLDFFMLCRGWDTSGQLAVTASWAVFPVLCAFWVLLVEAVTP